MAQPWRSEIGLARRHRRPFAGPQEPPTCYMFCGTHHGVSQPDRFRRRTRSDAPPTESEFHMSERLETLKKARERMADDRDAFAKTLAAPFDRDKAERARIKFIETQALIDAIDRAIDGERAGPAAAAA